MATITPKQIFGTAQTVIDTAVDIAASNCYRSESDRALGSHENGLYSRSVEEVHP